MIIELSESYTCKGVLPLINVEFDPSEAFGYMAGCGQVFPQPPGVTITASDP